MSHRKIQERFSHLNASLSHHLKSFQPPRSTLLLVLFFSRYYYDKDMLAKIQGKRYAYQFNFKALGLACQAQQMPTPSDAKIEDLSKVIAPLFSPGAAPAQPQSPTSPSESNLEDSSSIATSLETLLDDTYQVPRRLTMEELPDLGSNFWPDELGWRSTTNIDYESVTSSDQNSPVSSLNVLSPPQNPPNATVATGSSTVETCCASLPPMTSFQQPLAPLPPPPPYPHHLYASSSEHARSNSVPADMYYFMTNDNLNLDQGPS